MKIEIKSDFEIEFTEEFTKEDVDSWLQDTMYGLVTSALYSSQLVVKTGIQRSWNEDAKTKAKWTCDKKEEIANSIVANLKINISE